MHGSCRSRGATLPTTEIHKESVVAFAAANDAVRLMSACRETLQVAAAFG